MAKKLVAVVMVPHPRTGVVETFYPGDSPPAWAAKKITNPSAWAEDETKSSPARASGQQEEAPAAAQTEEPTGSDGEDDSAPAETPETDGEQPPAEAEAETEPENGEAPAATERLERPATSGPGSDKKSWRLYAEHIGVEVGEDWSRSDIQAAVDAVETKQY